MAKVKGSAEKPQEKEVSVGSSELAQALVAAIEAAKPVQKKNQFTRKEGTPWTPKDGSPKIKLRRKMYQHGLLMDPDFLTNDEISLLNKVRPGTYMNGHVQVVRRRDRGLSLEYPVKTAAQRLRLVSEFGIRNLSDLLKRCIDEAENPKQFIAPEDLD